MGRTEASAREYQRGYDVATMRAKSRLRIGWPLATLGGEDVRPYEDDDDDE